MVLKLYFFLSITPSLGLVRYNIVLTIWREREREGGREGEREGERESVCVSVCVVTHSKCMTKAQWLHKGILI